MQVYMPVWAALITAIGTFIGGGALTAIVAAVLKYKTFKEKTIVTITETVREDALKRQALADEAMSRYQVALETRIKALEVENETLHQKFITCEQKCDECDVARERQQREINELRLLVMKSESGGGVAIVKCDEQGIIVEWNEMSTVLFKYTWREAIGRQISMLMSPLYQPLHEAAFGHAVDNGTLKDTGWRDLMALDSMGNDTPVAVRISRQLENGKVYFKAEIKKRKTLPNGAVQ